MVSPAPSFKVAVVVSKKIASGASERNRLRRKMYQCLRQIEQHPAQYVLYPKKEALRAPYRELSAQIRTLSEPNHLV